MFLAVLLVGAGLRVLTQLAFSPALGVDESASWFSGAPAAVVAAQHLLGLATAIVVYVLLLRWGVARWLAAVATVPVLWDAHQLANEHLLLPDTLFVFVVASDVLVLCWRARPGVRAALLGGALLGAVVVGASVVPHVAWHQVRGAFPLLREETSAVPDALANALMAHQTYGHTPRPVLLGGLVLGLLAAAGAGRARRSGMRGACLLVAAVPAVMLLGAAVAGEDSWRHQLPGLAVLPAAGALGLTALLRGGRAPAAGRPQIDGVDRSALADFRERYGDPVLAPVVVVIAAYNEAAGLPRVLSTMPSTVCGLDADLVVVDDGSTDGTADAVLAHDGVYTVACPLNRGQGAALRLGYRVARDHGARFVITTDADGQYDTGDFPAVLSPVLGGTADFVTGSRRLGRQHTNDRFRRTGVYVFAWVMNVLTGERLTDTSFGLRAMRAEVTAAVTLNQPQYQSAELLIGVHSHGYRIAEVPGTMHLRAAGSTKKGGNLIYGTRYARVVLGTWWREGCPAPATEHAPALRRGSLLPRTARAPGT